MKLTILTPEESKIEWEKRLAENAMLTREQVQDWAISLPKGMIGNTDYIIAEDKWEQFYEWILTDEGYEQWKKDLDITNYIKNWSIQNGE